jgi:hypothetical protein
MEDQPDLMGVPGLPEEAVLEQLWHAVLEPVSHEMLVEAEETPPEELPVERFVKILALRAVSKKFRRLVDSTVEGTSLRLAVHFATSQGRALEKEALLGKVYRHYIDNFTLFCDEMEVGTCPDGSALLTTPLENLSLEQLAVLKMHLKEARCGQYAPYNTLQRFAVQRYVPPPPAYTRKDWGFLCSTG